MDWRVAYSSLDASCAVKADMVCAARRAMRPMRSLCRSPSVSNAHAVLARSRGLNSSKRAVACRAASATSASTCGSKGGRTMRGEVRAGRRVVVGWRRRKQQCAQGPTVDWGLRIGGSMHLRVKRRAYDVGRGAGRGWEGVGRRQRTSGMHGERARL